MKLCGRLNLWSTLLKSTARVKIKKIDSKNPFSRLLEVLGKKGDDFVKALGGFFAICAYDSNL